MFVRISAVPMSTHLVRFARIMRSLGFRLINAIIILSMILPGATEVAAAMPGREEEIPRVKSASSELSDKKSKRREAAHTYRAPVFSHTEPRIRDGSVVISEDVFQESTPTPTPSQTPTPTLTSTQSSSPTNTPTPSPTISPSQTTTPTPSNEPQFFYVQYPEVVEAMGTWDQWGCSVRPRSAGTITLYGEIKAFVVDWDYRVLDTIGGTEGALYDSGTYDIWETSGSQTFFTRRECRKAVGWYDGSTSGCIPLGLPWYDGNHRSRGVVGYEGQEVSVGFNTQVNCGYDRHLEGWLEEFGIVFWGDPSSVETDFQWETDVFWKSMLFSGKKKIPLGASGETDCHLGVSSNMNSAQGFVGDPINTKTGAFSFANVDISMPTRSCNLTFQPGYSSAALDEPNDALGNGWTHNHALKLIFPTDPGGLEEFVLFQGIDGNRYLFKVETDGSYTPGPGVTASLTRVEGPPVTYEIHTATQKELTFDENGQILSRVDDKGYGLTYSYDVNERLTQVSADDGSRYLDFAYDANDRISIVNDHTGRQVGYSYDANGDLISSTDVLGQVWTYTYDTAHRITQMTDPLAVDTVQTDYDAEGRAYRQTDALGNLLVEITYNQDGTSTVYDAVGNTNTHTYDSRNTLIDETGPLGGSTDKTYDANFRPATITDASGDSTQLSWSADGVNLTQVIDAAGNQTDLGYDALNNLTSVTDAAGHLTTYTYNGTLLTSSTDALNNTTSYTYTAEGELETVTDPLSNTTTYTYDQFGQMTSMTDALGNTTSYTYDNLGRLVDTTDALGRITHNEYDAAGRLVKVTRNYDPARPQNDESQYNIVTTYQYDAVGNQTAVTDTYGNSTQYVYDAAGRLITTIDPLGNQTSNAYNTLGQLVSTTDALGRTTSYSYDAAGRLVSTTDALGNVTTTAYNLDGTVASTTDALSNTTSYSYDGLKRVVSTTDALGSTTTTTYDQLGNVVSSNDALGRTTTYEYDALGRLIRQTNPEGGITETFYDANGNRVQTIDPNSNATTYAYDDLGRMVSVTDAQGNSTTYTYNQLSQRTAVTDALGRTTTYAYDYLGRLVSTTNAEGETSTTTYDALGRVTASTDALGRTTTSNYDALGRLTSTTNPASGTTSFNYDAVGNQTSVTNPNGATTTTSFDALNRPITLTDPNGNSTSTTYNAIGNVIESTDALGQSVSFGYDALGRQTSVSDPLGNSTQYNYDAVGNRISMTSANNVVTNYEYDGLNLLTAVVENYRAGFNPDHETNVRTEYNYDSNGNRLSITDGKGNVTSFGYDSLNRMSSESDALGNTWSYGYDAVGNRISTTDANGASTSYVYDSVYRLSTIDYPASDPDVTFNYDDAGQRTSMTDGLGTTTWSYDSLGRATSVTDPFGGTVGYGYDAVGNRTGLTYPDGKTVQYAFDSANRLVQVTDWENLITSYSYDAANRLSVANLPNGVASTYSYDASGRLLALEHAIGLETLSSFQYTYDAIGNRVQLVENVLQPVTAEPTATATPTSTATQTATATSTPTATSTTVSDLIFKDGFESGDFSAWSSSDTDGGSLTADAAAAYHGSYGMQAVIDDNSDVYVQDYSPSNETRYRARFYFDPNSISMSDGDSHYIFKGFSDTGSSVVYVELRYSASEYILRIRALEDDGGKQTSSWVTLSDAWQAIEFDWQAASSAGANDGSMTLWIAGTQAAQLTGIDNDQAVVDTARLGAVDGLDFNTRGTYFFDTFESRRVSYIGEISSEPTPTPTPVPSDTATATATASPSPTASASPTPLPTATPTPGDLTLNDGVLAHWKLDEADGTRSDSAGLNHLTDNNSVGQAAGKLAEAASFVRANSEYLSIADNPELSMGDVDFTVAGWIYFDTKQTVQDRNEHLFGKYDWSSNQREYLVSHNAATDRYELVVSEDGVNYTKVTANSFGAPVEGQWYFVVAWHDAVNDTLNIQVDDGAVDSVSHTTGVFDGSASFTIGGEVNSTINFLEGRTDSVTVWNRVLSADERSQLFNNGSGLDYPFGDPEPSDTITIIEYTYDPLGRLVAADYSDGNYFHYIYDAVGNRLTEDKSVSGLPSSVQNTYDIANRLTSVDGVAYTWDANGNMLSDGTSTYVYNTANRLISVTGSQSSVSFAYNGLNDRLQQTVDGVSTNYTLDLNIGLTQVLADNTNAYLYGVSRIGEQQSGGWAYHHGDALGSVRQLTDPAGVITLAQSYAPYGDSLNSVGDGFTTYQFTGEAKDRYITDVLAGQGLIYLRARMYAPTIGRFISKDVWPGDYARPLSLNRWMYVEGNPINQADPTGLAPCKKTGSRYCVLNDGGLIDLDHYRGSEQMAKDIIFGLKSNNRLGKEDSPLSLGQPFFPGMPHFRLTYRTSLPKEELVENDIIRVALGIFMDFQIRYESFQGLDPRCYDPLIDYITEPIVEGHCSSFSREDLVSDYLGFIDYVDDSMNFDLIINLLGGGEASNTPPAGFPTTNYKFTSFRILELDECRNLRIIQRYLPASLRKFRPIEAGLYWDVPENYVRIDLGLWY